MKNLLLLCVTVATGLCGCGQSEEKAPDPVKEYDSFLEAELKDANNRYPMVFFGKWNSSPQRLSEYTVNVEKTDSLVSPFVGTCRVRGALKSEGSQSDNLVMLEFDLVHAYQDGKWVSRGGTATILSVVNPDGEHMVMPNGKRFDGQTFKFGSLEDIFAGGVQ